MGMEVLEVNTPGELVMWFHLAQSEIRMGQDGAEIILDYMAEHGMTLAVRDYGLVIAGNGEEHTEYKPYSIDDAIHDVCEWNLELIQDMEDGMKNPADQREYNQFSNVLDILKKQEEVLNGLYQQTKYEQIAEGCALVVIAAALAGKPGVLEKLEAYQNGIGGQQERLEAQEEQEWQEVRQREPERGR